MIKSKQQNHWYLVIYAQDHVYCDENGTGWLKDLTIDEWVDIAKFKIIEAANNATACLKVMDNPKGYYPDEYDYNRVFNAIEFESKEEAEKHIKKITRNEIKDWVTDYTEFMVS